MNPRRWVTLGVFAAAVSSAPGRAVAQLAPSGSHYAGRASDTGHMGSVSSSGGYGASVALDLPPSRGDLPVPLQISYREHGVGAAGLGWDVPLSYIRRDTTIARQRPVGTSGGIPTSRAQLFLLLDGQRLDLVPKGAIWVARRDGAQLEVRTSADGTMSMYDGAGRTYRFSAEGPAGGAALLAGNLLLLRDVNGPGGNNVHLEYNIAAPALPDGSGLSIDLASISYNPSPTTAHCYKNQVVLSYDPPVSPPLSISMLGDQPLARATKLHQVDSYGKAGCVDAPVRLRQHVLSYQEDPDTRLPRLQSVKLFGQDGIAEGNSPVPLGTYKYGSASQGGILQYQKTQTIAVPARFGPDAYISRTFAGNPFGPQNPFVHGFYTSDNFLDLTGDGRPDWLGTDLGGSLTRNVPGANGSTSFETRQTPLGHHLDGYNSQNFRFFDFNTEDVFSQTIDVNGDGRVDLVQAAVEGQTNVWEVLLNTPDPADPSQVVWVSRRFPVLDLRVQLPGIFFLGVDVPLGRRFTGHGSKVQECYRWDGSHWVKDDDGFHDGACPLLENEAPPDVPVPDPEVTFTEWELKDVNGDGYVDLIANSSPVIHKIESDVDKFDPPERKEFFSRRSVRRETIVLQAGAANQVVVFLNVFGTHLDDHGTLPFAAPALLRASTDCGVAKWKGNDAENQSQSLVCDFTDVNGDGIIDRVENTNVYLGTGRLALDGFFTPSALITLPDTLALQGNPRTSECPIGSPADKIFTSAITIGLRDLNGDGIPDYVRGREVRFGTGAGFGAPIAVQSEIPFAMSVGSERCDGTNAMTVGGLYDIDGDGKPEMVRINGASLDVYQLVGGSRAGIPEAGRITQIDNGYGASTRITYRSAKEDTTTPHQIPFPEVVVFTVDTVRTEASGSLLSATLYAYGNASLIFDPASDTFMFPGYGRTAELRLTNAPEGIAVINDTYPLTPFDPADPASSSDQARFGRYLRTGRPSDATVLSGDLGTDPQGLLAVDINADARRIVRTHYNWGTRSFPEPSIPSTEDCVDMVFPYDYHQSSIASAGLPNLCSAHGFALGVSTQSRRIQPGSASSSAPFVTTGWDVNSIDDFGRVLSVTYFNDLARADDDLCVDISYANPTGPNERVLSAVASQRTRKCGGSLDTPIVYAEGEWRYDSLSAGSVSAGFPTAYTVKRHDDAGALLRTVREYDAFFDPAGNPRIVSATREDGAVRRVALTYDPFGLAVVRSVTSATAAQDIDVSTVRDPVTLDVTSTIDHGNGIVMGTTYDGFGRAVASTVAQTQAPSGALSTVSYLGFAGGDPLGRRIVQKVFTDPVDPTTAGTAVGRTSTLYLDELGRAQRTELALGADYSSQTLVVGQRMFDFLGRTVFEADPFPSTQDPTTAYGTSYFFNTDGTPSCTIRANGRLETVVKETDEVHEIFPTCYQRTFQDNIEVTEVRDPASLLPSSPQSGVIKMTYSTAIGRAFARVTWQARNGELNRLEHASFAYDALGHLNSMTRYGDPAAGANPVTTSWHYDSLGQLLELDEPDAVPQFNSYSDWGELIKVHRVTASPASNLDVVKRYDGLGRVIHSEEQRDGVVDAETVNDYLYDHAVNIAPQVRPINVVGKLAQAISPTGSVSFGYDLFGNINARVFTDPQGGAYVEKHTFHADGTRATLDLFLPDTGFADEHVDYRYDSAGRGRSIKTKFDSFPGQDLYQSEVRDPWGRIRQAHYGPASYTASYDDVGRRLMKQVALSSSQGTRSINYESFDPLGRERSRSERKSGLGVTQISTTTSVYDALGRLSSSAQTVSGTAVFSQQLVYDALGNILRIENTRTSSIANTTMTYLATDRDRICHIDYGHDSGTDCNVSYDETGSIVAQPTRDGARQISYLVGGKVRSISQSRFLSNTTAHYRYDAFGDVQELDATGDGVPDNRRDRLYGGLIGWHLAPGSVDDSNMVLWRTIPGFDGAVATRRGSAGPWIWAFGEDRGNRFFVDDTGAFVQDVDYSPFGEATSTGSSGFPGSNRYSNQQWNGGDALAAFGVSQLGARLYDPAIGRFLSRDPLLIPLTATTTNPYAFAMNDPVNGSDPTGLCGEGDQFPCWDKILLPPSPWEAAKWLGGSIASLNPFGGHDEKHEPPRDYSRSFWGGVWSLTKNVAADGIDLGATVGGGIVGAGAGAALGIESGPGLIVTGAAGAWAGASLGAAYVYPFTSQLRGQTPTFAGMRDAAIGGGLGYVGGQVAGQAVSWLGRSIASVWSSAAGNAAKAEASTAIRGLTQGELKQVVGGVPSQAARVLQTGGHTIEKQTANALNETFGKSLHPREWGRALESLKEELNLPNEFHGKIMSDGSYLDKLGNYLGNLREHL